MRKIAIAVLLLALATPAFAEADQSKEGKLYDRASSAVDDHEWSKAVALFRAVTAMHGEHADASLYWLAYSQNKMGLRSEALASIVELNRNFPNSRWIEDARALEVEIRQSAGQHIEVEEVTDEDAKLIALAMQMSSDPDHALPELTQIVVGHQPLKLKQRALFVMTQSGNPKAVKVLDKVALDPKEPELQAVAVRFLGVVGGEESRKVLADVYANTKDLQIKGDCLHSFMTAGDLQQLMNAAKTEVNLQLRSEAVAQLGAMGAREALSTLYTTEPSPQVRGRIIQSMVIGGNLDKLVEIAKNEKVVQLRIEAIRNLGLMGGKTSGEQLVVIYNGDPQPAVRRSVIESLFLQGNAKALVQLARAEKNVELRRDIRQKLTVMRSKDAADFLEKDVDE